MRRDRDHDRAARPGLATAVRMAIAEQSLGARFEDRGSPDLCLIAGDGRLMEGISQEAITLAGKQRLGKLIVLWDDNGISIDGGNCLADRPDDRFAAAGWSVHACDGHDPEDINRAPRSRRRRAPARLHRLQDPYRWGAPTKQDSKVARRAARQDVTPAVRTSAGTAPPFEVPEVYAGWDGGRRARRGERRGTVGAAASRSPPSSGLSSTRVAETFHAAADAFARNLQEGKSAAAVKVATRRRRWCSRSYGRVAETLAGPPT